MKYLLLTLLLGIPALLLYLRLRPYLRFFREVLGVFREAQNGKAMSGRPGVLTKKPATGEALTRCAACGAWSPATQMVKLGAQQFCSHECLEKMSARKV